MKKIFEFLEKNYILLILIIILPLLFIKRKKEQFSQDKLFKIKFNFKNPVNSILIDYNNKIFKPIDNKKYFMVPKGIYKNYIQVLENNKKKYLFPPKLLKNIKIEKNICLNNLYNKSSLNCSANPIKLLESNKNIKIKVYYEFLENNKIKLKEFPYVEIIAFDNNNRSMITLTDTNGVSKLKLLESDNIYWSLIYNLPTIEEVYDAVTDEDYGLYTYYEVYEGKKYFVYNMEKENDKFVYKPYIEGGNFITDEETLKYIKDNIKLPKKWVNNVKQYYGIDIKSKEEFLETINKLNDIYNSVNTLIKSDNYIYKNNKKLTLPINPKKFKNNDEIKIIIPNVKNYLRLNFSIKNINNLNVKNIKINLYQKNDNTPSFEFYSKTSDIKKDGTFYIFIDKNIINKSKFKLVFSSPNEFHESYKINDENINYFSIKLNKQKNLEIDYFNENSKNITKKIIKKDHIFDSSDTYNYFKYKLYKLNDNIEFIKNDYKLDVVFKLPENYKNKINDINGIIIATSKNGNYIIQKNFNLKNLKDKKLTIPIKLHFNNLSFWNIDYQLDRNKADENRIYYKSINEVGIKKNNNKAVFELKYLDREVEINVNSNIKGNINVLLKPEVNISDKNMNNIDHNIIINNGINKKIYIFSDYLYSLKPTIDNILLEKFLQPKEKIIKFKDKKLNIKLINKNKDIQINVTNKNDFVEIYCNIKINNIKINKNITNDNIIKINDKIKGKMELKVLGIKEDDDIIYTNNYSGNIKNKLDLNLEKSDFINFKQNCFYIKSDSSYTLQIIKNKNLDIELEIPENSLYKKPKKLFVFVKSAYYLIDDYISKYFIPINIEVITNDGEKILETLSNKNIKCNFKYFCGTVQEGLQIKKIIKKGSLLVKKFTNIMIKDNSPKIYKMSVTNKDKNDIIKEEFINKEGHIIHSFDMRLVSLMNDNRYTETVNDNNQTEGINMNEEVEMENVNEIESEYIIENFAVTTEKHLHSKSLWKPWKGNLEKYDKYDKKLLFYYIENGKTYYSDYPKKISIKHEEWQETFIETLFNFVSSITAYTWTRTYDRKNAVLDIYQFSEKILPKYKVQSVAGFASSYNITPGGGKMKAIIVNKSPRWLGDTSRENFNWWKATMSHELGHALGLSHTHSPHCDNPSECQKNDSDKCISVMSYKTDWPMLYASDIFSELDIKVLQHYWGKNEENYVCPYDEGIFWISNKNPRCKKV